MSNLSGFPLNVNAATKEINSMLHEMMGSTGEMVNMLMKLKAKGMMIPDDERLSPDPYGCDKLFIDFFITDKMRDDFPLVVRDFLYKEFSKIDEYEDMAYFDMDAGDDAPETLFNRFVLNLMVDAVKGGSEYSKALILQLYKTYYKKEYQSLKRFSSISADEILSLSEPEGGTTFYFANIARILFVAKLSGISFRDDCSYIYAFLNEYADRIDSCPRYTYADEVMDVYDDCVKEIESRFDIDKLYKIEGRLSKYLGNVLKWLGFGPEYVELCDISYNGIVDHLATTLAILKKTYPGKNKEYSAEELVLYSMVLHSVGAATSNHEWMTDELRKVFYGPDVDGFYEDFPPLFHSEDVQHKAAAKKTETPKMAQPAAKIEEPVYNEKKLLEELEVMRRKVHKLEADNCNLRIDLSEKRKVDEENRSIKAQMESSNRELAALRSYVYGLTESDEPVQSEPVEKMKKEISALRIIIIGGHTNWVSKLKKEFPNWDFVNPEASGTTAVSIINNADRVYFFTDTISHSKYYQFMNAIRENKVEFGYIHGVNIEKNIRDIYRDISEEA